MLSILAPALRLTVLVVSLYMAATLDCTLAPTLQIAGIAPDFLALVALMWLFTQQGPRTFLVAGAIGLVADLNAAGHIGLGAALWTLAGFVLIQLRRYLRLDHLAAQVPVAWLVTTLVTLGIACGARLLGDTWVPWTQLPITSAYIGGYTAAMGLPLFMVASWIREPALARGRKLAEAA